MNVEHMAKAIYFALQSAGPHAEIGDFDLDDEVLVDGMFDLRRCAEALVYSLQTQEIRPPAVVPARIASSPRVNW